MPKNQITKEEKLVLRKAIRKYKLLKQQIAPLEKEKEKVHGLIKEMVAKYEMDFDTPEGRTDSRPNTRISYNRDKLDEMIESGVFDADTAALIRGCRQETAGYSVYVL